MVERYKLQILNQRPLSLPYIIQLITPTKPHKSEDDVDAYI